MRPSADFGLFCLFSWFQLPLRLFKNPIRPNPSIIPIAIVGSAIPPLMPVSRKSIAEIRASDARERARHRLSQSSWGELLFKSAVADSLLRIVDQSERWSETAEPPQV